MQPLARGVRFRFQSSVFGATKWSRGIITVVHHTRPFNTGLGLSAGIELAAGSVRAAAVDRFQALSKVNCKKKKRAYKQIVSTSLLGISLFFTIFDRGTGIIVFTHNTRLSLDILLFAVAAAERLIIPFLSCRRRNIFSCLLWHLHALFEVSNND